MQYDFVTFDCYGTLIDWESGIANAFAKAKISSDRDAVIRAYHEVEPQVESEPYRRYRDVLSETAVRVAGHLGRDLRIDEACFLPESLPFWKPFPDTNPALEMLHRTGCELGILSNVDNDLLRQTIRLFPVDFTLMITAEQVRSYKPAHGHFLEARRRLTERRWLHAAQSYFHDIVPAVELGIAAAWINRKNEVRTGRARPTAEFADLKGFAAWVALHEG